MQTEITREHHGFIDSWVLFFLTTIDHRGYPTCSYKGGDPGFVKVVDSNTIAFPSYNSNGMFLSISNINTNNKVGLLFIDFETPHRVRAHGQSSIDKTDPLIEAFHEAVLNVRVKLTEIFVN